MCVCLDTSTTTVPFNHTQQLGICWEWICERLELKFLIILHQKVEWLFMDETTSHSHYLYFKKVKGEMDESSRG